MSAPGTVPVSCLPEPDDVKIDEGTMLPERCHVSGFAGVQSSLRGWLENDLQFPCSDFVGKQKRVGQRNASSLRCWLETDEQFHVSESKGPLHGRRRRGARTISTSRCSSSAQGGRVSACSTRFLGSAEAGSGLVPSSHSFVACDSLSLRVESPSSRVQRVTAALHGAWCLWFFLNSENSVGDTEDGGLRFLAFTCCENPTVRCVLGATKALSTSTRCGVRRPAVEKLHEETWAGLLTNQGLRISQEVEIVPGCAGLVTVGENR